MIDDLQNVAVFGTWICCLTFLATMELPEMNKLSGVMPDMTATPTLSGTLPAAVAGMTITTPATVALIPPVTPHETLDLLHTAHGSYIAQMQVVAAVKAELAKQEAILHELMLAKNHARIVHETALDTAYPQSVE